jgi:hypothetical protein
VCYYTQLIYLKPGREDFFHLFEEQVLPVLKKYNDSLLLRWRRTPDCVIETSVGTPYEVHLVSFASRDDFKNYAKDETRQSVLHLKDESVERVVLIEGDEI